MTIYYTAKDVEELASKGIQQIEVGPNVSLTDFARETAQQLDIKLVNAGAQAPSPATPGMPARQGGVTGVSDKYNKPAGCQHGPNSPPAANSGQVAPSRRAKGGANSNTVNSLIDLMDKAIKRGE
jgi:hypothetical protein